MPDALSDMTSGRLRALREGAALALSTFTIAPVRPAEVDRRTAAVAMGLAAPVGVLLGMLVGGLALLLRLGHPPAVLIGVVCVAASAVLTRGLHLDGLADTVDALGSYHHAERALAIMKSPEIGPFGVVAIVLALLVPAASIAGLATRPWWQLLCGVAAAFGAGRAAVTLACRRGIPAARPNGLGAMVASSVGVPALAAAMLFVMALSLGADWHRPWHGIVSVLAGLVASDLLVRHSVRRFGGITGDVLGAAVEVTTAVTLVGICL